jgi:hypothetical protein
MTTTDGQASLFEGDVPDDWEARAQHYLENGNAGAAHHLAKQITTAVPGNVSIQAGD